MCGIAGIVSEVDRELGPLLKEMLMTLEHRGPDGAGFVIGDSCERQLKFENLDFQGKKGRIALGHVRLAITGGKGSLQPIRSETSPISLLHNGEIYNYKELARRFDGDRFPADHSDSDVLIQMLEREYNGDLSEAVKKVLPELDGVYSLAITDGKQTVIVRDRIGVRQLYYCKISSLISFASEKKPLLELEKNELNIQRLLPGHMMTITSSGSQIDQYWDSAQMKVPDIIRDRDKAMDHYGQAITGAVHKRVSGKDRVGIIYSGGLDSVLIAYLVQSLGVPFTCYTSGRGENAVDVAWARKTAEQLGFPLEVTPLTNEKIETMIPEIIRVIEDQSLNQVEVAIPIFAAVRNAQENGERVILSGQGADELFGGYPWYSSIVDQEGYDNFVDRSWEDTFLLYKECLEREDKIAMAHSLELRVPYLDPRVVQTAFQIDPRLKIKSGGDQSGKRIHREYCKNLGIPDEIAYRKKEAAQHGANVHDALTELAEKHKLTPDLMDEAGYHPDKTVPEKLGSSSRYGFRYGQQDLWEPLSHVQYYLDSHAAHLGLLSPLKFYHWNQVKQKLSDKGLNTTLRGSNEN